jgi:ER membrane protein complex subunit 2
MHARLGEVLLMASEALSESSRQYLAEALKRFARSVELCDDYLRGYYGMKQTTDRVLSDDRISKERQDDGFALPDRKVIEHLNEVATEKLAEIVRKNGAGEIGWQGYNAGEITAAKSLIEKAALVKSR